MEWIQAAIWTLCIVGAAIAAGLFYVGYQIEMFRRSRMIIALALASAGSAQAQPKKEFVGPNQPVQLKRLLTPSDAQALVWMDLQTLPPYLQQVSRYLWIQEPSVESIKSLSITINRISRAVATYRPVVLAENRLIRVDLRKLCLVEKTDLPEMIETWEQLRFCPDFNELITPDMLKVILTLPETQWPLALVRSDKGFASTKLSALAEADVIRVIPKHLDPKALLDIQLATFSAAPVITKEYFELRALTTIQGEGPYKAIWSGLYYRFKDIKKSPNKNTTDLEFLLEQVGATGKRVAEQRIGIRRSKVTGNPRSVDFLPATNLRVGDGQAFVTITDDTKRTSIDTSQRALRTLNRKTFRADGHEVIYSGNNGLQAYALYDGKGSLVDEVPPDIAADTTVPAQFPKQLQAAISCIRCHEAEGSDGLKSVSNDVDTFLKKGIDVFGDISNPSKLISEDLQELGAQYRGNPDKFIKQARNNYQSMALECSGLWENTKPTDILKVAAKKLESDTNDYWYGDITPERALRRLGFAASPKDTAIVFLRRLLKPDADSRAFGIQPEDIDIAALIFDMPGGVSQQELSFVLPFMYSRAAKELQRMAKEAKP